MTKTYKQPVSVLIVVHTPDDEILLLERADFPEHWQSITGSIEPGETLLVAARRELHEETGLNAERDGVLTDMKHDVHYEIFEQWQHRYPPETTQNNEHWFSLLVPSRRTIVLSEREHLRYLWLPALEAAEKVFSPSNRDAILTLRDNQSRRCLD
jgi:NTP pyrophosphohydrolases including oxidative damage repair enzymes